MIPQQQPVTVQVTDAHGVHNVTFHPSREPFIPISGVIGADLANTVNKAYSQLIPYEKDLINWMALSPANASLYYKDPIRAITSSKINIPAEVINNLKSASELLVQKLKK